MPSPCEVIFKLPCQTTKLIFVQTITPSEHAFWVVVELKLKFSISTIFPYFKLLPRRRSVGLWSLVFWFPWIVLPSLHDSCEKWSNHCWIQCRRGWGELRLAFPDLISTVGVDRGSAYFCNSRRKVDGSRRVVSIDFRSKTHRPGRWVFGRRKSRWVFGPVAMGLTYFRPRSELFATYM